MVSCLGQLLKYIDMTLTCPECKNQIDLSSIEVAEDAIIECDTCGITLAITSVNGDAVEAEIVDEGK